MTTIKQLKKELGLTNKDLAQFFDMSLDSFQNTSAKTRYETALCRFYDEVNRNKLLTEINELKAEINAFNISCKISEQAIKEIDEQNKKQ